MTAPPPRASAPSSNRGGSLEDTIGRLLTIGTYLGIGILAVGTLLMLASGISPLDPSPALVLSAIPAQILAGEPIGVLWLGILAVVALPGARVAAALVGFWRSGERSMALVAIGILVVIAIGVVVGVMAG